MEPTGAAGGRRLDRWDRGLEDSREETWLLGAECKDERLSGMTTTGMISTLASGTRVVVLVEKERSEDMLLRSWSEMRAALWIRRCCDPGFEAIDVRSDLEMGELAERRDLFFSVCRSIR